MQSHHPCLRVSLSGMWVHVIRNKCCTFSLKQFKFFAAISQIFAAMRLHHPLLADRKLWIPHFVTSYLNQDKNLNNKLSSMHRVCTIQTRSHLWGVEMIPFFPLRVFNWVIVLPIRMLTVQVEKVFDTLAPVF